MKDILSEIIAEKRHEVDQQKKRVPLDRLQEMIDTTRCVHSVKRALTNSATGIIAEFKRRSPSKGWIHQSATPEAVVLAYVSAGASAISILTDEKFFGGTLQDIQSVRQSVAIPILRKEFILDEYQITEARAVGADAVLLIAAALSPERCRELTAKAHALHLEVLLEIHRPEELSYITPEIDMVGINNRNLGSFVTDVENSFRLAEAVPRETLLVSESGISSPETVTLLRNAGFRGFLIGETFMKSPQPGVALQHFIQKIQ